LRLRDASLGLVGGAMMALAFLLVYLLWNEHTLMKDDPKDKCVHNLMAKLNLVLAAVYAFSVFQPTNPMAYIAGWGRAMAPLSWSQL
jgi:multisubunit Na+/H+ antiporter MnhB subunit